MKTYRNRAVEKNVLNFLKMISCSQLRFPFNPFDASLALSNCKIHSYQSFSEKHSVSFDEVVSYCQSYTGCTHNQNGKFIIMFNDSPNIIKERKTFTIAHELGHILSGHFDNMNYRQLAQNETSDKILEREANHFAACLLSPIPIIHKLKLNSIVDIQSFFNLSYEAAEIAWRDYKNYDRNYNIPWHNDILNLYRHSLPSRI